MRPSLANSAVTDWRYVPVRRLVNAISRDVATTLQNAVFESGTPPTWELDQR